MRRLFLKLWLFLLALCVMLITSGCTLLDSFTYQKAVEQFEQGKLVEAHKLFAEIADYEASAQYVSYLEAMELAIANEHAQASACFAELGNFYDSQTLSVYHAARYAEIEERYEEAEQLYQQITAYGDSAQRLAALPASIKNRNQKQRADRYAEAQELLNTGSYEKAIAILTELSDYEEASKFLMYSRAMQMAEEGDYELAINSFISLGNFRDSSLQVTYYRARWAESELRHEDAEDLYRTIAAFRDSAQRLNNQADLILDRDFAAFKAYGMDETYPSVYELSLEKYHYFRNDEDLIALLSCKYSASETRMYENFYEFAEELLEKNWYYGARKVFKLLSDCSYLDADIRVLDVIFAEAQSEMADGFFVTAAATLNGLIENGYTAALEARSECYYRMGFQAEEQLDYANAYVYYVLAGDYQDCVSKAARFDTEYAAAEAMLTEGKYLEAVEAFSALHNYSDAADRIQEVYYKYALALMDNREWAAASEAFVRAGDYLDAASRINEPFYKQAEALLAQKEWEAASKAFTRAGDYSDAASRINEPFYKQGETLLTKEMYGEALVAFVKAADYANADEMILMIHYTLAEKALERGQYDVASEEFKNAKSYSDAKLRITEPYYVKGEQLIAEKRYIEAITAFTKANGFSDADEKILFIHYTLAEKALASGDYDKASLQFRAAKDYRDAAERIKEPYYVKAEKLLAEEKFEEAIEAFETISDYGDSILRVQMIHYLLAEKAMAVGDYDQALVEYTAAGTYWNAPVMIKECTYQKALLLMRDQQYSEALTILQSINPYSGSDMQIQECLYQIATDVFEAGDYEEAEKRYTALGDYKDSATKVKACIYQYGIALYTKAEYDLAQTIFETLEDYSDSAEKVKACIYAKADMAFAEENYEAAQALFKSILDYRDAYERAGECNAYYADLSAVVTLGRWEQNKDWTDGMEPIEWIILDRSGSKVLLLSKYGLEAQAFDQESSNVWEHSTLREWLNDDFYHRAFQAEEKSYIALTNVDNSATQGKPTWSVASAANTQDNVFLLSYSEVQKYFASDESRKCEPTEQAISQKAWYIGSGKGNQTCWWWLRSPGGKSNEAIQINGRGTTETRQVTAVTGAVRPAMWVDAKCLQSLIPSNDAAKGVVYAKAKAALNRNDHETAKELLEQILDYSDAQKLYDEYFTPSAEEAVVGTKLQFGRWEQDGITSNGEEPITWVVAKVQDDCVLLVSRDYLDYQPYHTSKHAVTWQDSFIRSWLNGSFLNGAFTETEKNILVDTVVAPASANHRSTKDKVFLLSTEEEAEAIPVFNGVEPARTPAVAAKANRLNTSWLRNSGSHSASKAAVASWPNVNTTVCLAGRTVTEKQLVMPAMCVNFKQLKILLNGEEGENATEISTSASAVGSSVFLGRYEQDNDLSNGPEPIEWLVLERNGSKTLLLSKYGLTAKNFYNPWKNSDLREWLNSDFLKNTFNVDEQKSIQLSTIESYSLIEGTSEGLEAYNTSDFVFLLSHTEVAKYLPTNENRKCIPTDYAIAQGASLNKAQYCEGKNTGWWMLRTTTAVINPAKYGETVGVSAAGTFSWMHSSYPYGIVRPAIWVDSEWLQTFSTNNDATKGIIYANDRGEMQAEIQHKAYSDIQAGDYVVFGHWEQDDDLSNGTEPLEWIVLDRQGDRILVMTKYCHDIDYYQNPDFRKKLKEICKYSSSLVNSRSVSLGNLNWEIGLPRWTLNTLFMKDAFSVAEQAAIPLVTVKAEENPFVEEYISANDTQDKIFILSYSEAEKYLTDWDMRIAVRTTADMADYSIDLYHYQGWQLRLPAKLESPRGVYTSRYYGIDTDGNYTFIDGGGISGSYRPVCWIDLKLADGLLSFPKAENEADASYSVGTELILGCFEQDNNDQNGTEPIEWKIVSRDGNRALLLSKHVLWAMRYNRSKTCTWDNSEIRSWLNETFLPAAFSEQESSVIALRTVRAETYHAGAPTHDKVFLLSATEMENYLPVESARVAKATPYALAQRLESTTESGECRWWLRSSASSTSYADNVKYDGSISISKIVDADRYGIRPAIWVNLDDENFEAVIGH